MTAHPGQTVRLTGAVSDPDLDQVSTTWWQFFEEGTYPGAVTVTENGNDTADVEIPADAKPGQTISMILQGTDNGQFPLTRYSRTFIHMI